MSASAHSTPTEVLVLIVGAGPTGLTLACDLTRRGVDYRLIDQAPEPFIGTKGKGLMPRSLEVFDDLGIIDQVLRHGRFHLPIRLYEGHTVLGDEDVFAGLEPTPAVPYASNLWIPQWRVEEALRQVLSSAARGVEQATTLLEFEQDAQGVTATLQTPTGLQRVRCRYLVGADGGRSQVRKRLPVGFAGTTTTGLRMYAGDVRVEGLDREHAHAWLRHPAGMVSLCPFVTTDAFQFQAMSWDEDAPEPSLALFQQLLNERSGRRDIRLHSPTWLSRFRRNERMADRFQVGRVLLAGDAAHVHSPAGGQGMNTGIQDAYNLGWKLDLVLRHGANATLLATYDAERRPVAAKVLELSQQQLGRVNGVERQLPNDPRNLQLGIHYRRSPLSRHATTAPLPLQAGDRAPDAPLRDPHGTPRRLFDFFRGPHFTLLGTGRAADPALQRLRQAHSLLRTYAVVDAAAPAEPTTAPDLGRLLDDEGHFRRAYGAQPGILYLVRPDGYLGFVGDATAPEAAQAYLQQFQGPVG